MSAKETLRSSKLKLLEVFSGDYRFILNRVEEEKLITAREYNNLKSINKEDVEGHVVELVDKIMNKGEKTCQLFLDLLQTDEAVKATYPELDDLQLSYSRALTRPVQETPSCCGDMVPENKRQKKEDFYVLQSHPVGLCLIINNETFTENKSRRGTNKDADSLAEVFSWLGFRVLMCKDQTSSQMLQTVNCFACLGDGIQLQESGLQEWSGSGFTAPQQLPQHGDAFVCCILSHGSQGVVLGTDSQPLAIKDITRSFRGTGQSALTGKPKVFLIQACQGVGIQRGVPVEEMEEDSLISIPEEADVLVAVATVEGCVSFRHPVEGSWFVQSVCEQLREHCPRGEDILSILLRVNHQVGQKEGSGHLGKVKQAPVFSVSLRKKLLLWPHSV